MAKKGKRARGSRKATTPRRPRPSQIVRAIYQAEDDERKALQAAREARERKRRLKQYELGQIKSAKKRTAIVTDIQKITRLSELGLYNPKGKKTRKGKLVKPTKSQRKRARSLWDKAGDLVSTAFFPVKITTKSKAKRNRIKRRASQAGLKATDKYVFIRNDNVYDAKLKSSRMTEFEIVGERRFKRSRTGRAGEKFTVPLASADELETKRQQMQSRYEKLRRSIGNKKDHYIRFYVEGKFGSRRIFQGDQFDDLWQELLSYRDEQAAQYGFINTITLGVWTPDMPKDILEDYEMGDDGDVIRTNRRVTKNWKRTDASGRNTGRRAKRKPSK